eukprot:6393526-Alexandrium_andersonii.AAC.1
MAVALPACTSLAPGLLSLLGIRTVRFVAALVLSGYLLCAFPPDFALDARFGYDVIRRRSNVAGSYLPW